MITNRAPHYPRLLLVLATAVLAWLPAPAASADTHDRVDRAQLAERAERVVEKRGSIEVLEGTRCRPLSRGGPHPFSRWLCRWRAEGIWADGIPYRCAGKAVRNRQRNTWKVGECKNELQARIPLMSDPGPAPAFGYNDDWTELSNSTFQLMAQARPELARVPIAWANVESEPGTYHWAHVDRTYEKLRGHGVRPLWALIEAPCWAQPDPGTCREGDSQHRPAPQHYDAFARFAAATAQRYGASIGIEVGNEPNFPHFWGGAPDPALYGQMLIKAADSIHAAAPEIPVVSAGLSPHSDSADNALGYNEFLTALYESGAAQHADAIAVHPYPNVSPDEDYVDAMRIQLGKIDRIMSAHGDADKPMWVTEIGVSTTGPEAFSPDEQGQAMAELYSALHRVENLPVIAVHRFLDQPRLSRGEGGFAVVAAEKAGLLGLLPSEFELKPAYCALNLVRGVGC